MKQSTTIPQRGQDKAPFPPRIDHDEGTNRPGNGHDEPPPPPRPKASRDSTTKPGGGHDDPGAGAATMSATLAIGNLVRVNLEVFGNGPSHDSTNQPGGGHDSTTQPGGGGRDEPASSLRVGGRDSTTQPGGGGRDDSTSTPRGGGRDSTTQPGGGHDGTGAEAATMSATLANGTFVRVYLEPLGNGPSHDSTTQPGGGHDSTNKPGGGHDQPTVKRKA